MSTLPMFIGIVDSMTECSYNQNERKKSQPHTNKKEKESEREKKMLNNTIKIAKWKKGEKKTHTTRTDRILLKIDTHKCIWKRQCRWKRKINRNEITPQNENNSSIENLFE